MDRWTPLTDRERDQFVKDGCVLLRGVVPAEQRRRIEQAADRHYERAASAGNLGADGELHSRGVLTGDIEFIRLADHGPVFRWLWGLLGWNIYSHHNHLDVNPPVTGPAKPEPWAWHQDGLRQNSDAEVLTRRRGTGPPRPQFSIKACFVFSDLSRPGRGATRYLPGSHLRNVLPPPEDPFDYEHPPGARELLASPGDVLLFDRRLWHSRSRNVSSITRVVLFISYTYRWIRPLDPMPFDEASPLWDASSPVQRQLLGAGPNAADFWGIHNGGGLNDGIPLRAELLSHGLLDRTIPWLR
jgi:hypothetical protein